MRLRTVVGVGRQVPADRFTTFLPDPRDGDHSRHAAQEAAIGRYIRWRCKLRPARQRAEREA
jgi:hypothetical protein